MGISISTKKALSFDWDHMLSFGLFKGCFFCIKLFLLHKLQKEQLLFPVHLVNWILLNIYSFPNIVTFFFPGVGGFTNKIFIIFVDPFTLWPTRAWEDYTCTCSCKALWIPSGGGISSTSYQKTLIKSNLWPYHHFGKFYTCFVLDRLILYIWCPT